MLLLLFKIYFDNIIVLMNSQKGFAPIIIIIIAVAMLGIGAGSYVLVSKRKVASPAPLATVEPQPVNAPTVAEELPPPPRETKEQSQEITQPQQHPKAKLSLVKVSKSGICLKNEGSASIPAHVGIQIDGQSAYITSFARFPSITDTTFDPGEAFVYGIDPQNPTFKVGSRVQVVDETGYIYPYLSNGEPDYWIIKNIVVEEGWATGAPGTAPFRLGGFASCPDVPESQAPVSPSPQPIPSPQLNIQDLQGIWFVDFTNTYEGSLRADSYLQFRENMICPRGMIGEPFGIIACMPRRDNSPFIGFSPVTINGNQALFNFDGKQFIWQISGTGNKLEVVKTNYKVEGETMYGPYDANGTASSIGTRMFAKPIVSPEKHILTKCDDTLLDEVKRMNVREYVLEGVKATITQCKEVQLYGTYKSAL